MQFFKRYARESSTLWLIGSDLAAEFSTLHTEIRAVDPAMISRMIASMDIFKKIEILDMQSVEMVSASKIITATENISRQVVMKYFPQAEVVYDNVFLRYDESKVKSFEPVVFDRKSADLFDLRMMSTAIDEADKTSDWWRHIGAVLVKDRKVIAIDHNQPVPSEHMPYVFGNPRDFIEAGKLSHFSDALHAEKAVFAQAAKLGISTKGAWIYTSVFPCPDCAMFIAYSGVSKCFYRHGHASLNGEKVLRSQKVEIVYVPNGPAPKK